MFVNVASEYYERRAEYCEQMARAAPTSDLRLDWLRLAGQWREMIRRGPEHSLPEDTESAPGSYPADVKGERAGSIGPHAKDRH